ATGNRDGIGAVVTVRLAGARSLTRYVHTDGSYLSASDPRLCFGLGVGGTATSLTVRWPDGRVQLIDHPPNDRLLTIRPPGE
ncbi:MAG: CRTAC1 family protein, partial [Acidobacteria bacterium]|nr:CRTAC1 family protein [Acidobacteriota bacterium]